MSVVFKAKHVVALTVALVLLYILWIGPERFYYESFGTLLLSPLIYERLLPLPFHQWLGTHLYHFPLISDAICLVPILMLVLAIAAGVYSLRKNSLPFALASLFLTATVFSVYHYVQPMGLSAVYH